MKKNTVKTILSRMEEAYGTDVPCFLEHKNAWQLLIATILSAQCTDARVNLVTKDLFRKYRSVKAFAEADLKELEKDIHSTGFYRNKAKNIIACCRRLRDDFGGEVPCNIDELTTLPGVGRKTANVIRTHIYHEPSIVVDTHVGRVARRLGLTAEEDPVKVEFELMKKIPKEHWSDINTWFILLGRSVCRAQRPACEECFLKDLCPYRNDPS